MRAAIYYPDTKIRDIRLLKTALLLWDEVSFIVPTVDYPLQSNGDPEVAEAVEIIGTRHCPNKDERRETHERVEEFFTRTLPSAFDGPNPFWDVRRHDPLTYETLINNGVPEAIYYLKSEYEYECKEDHYSDRSPYTVDVRMFLPQTYEVLEHLRSAGGLGQNGYSTTQATGLVLMSILADCCAGETHARITDRPNAYATITGLLAHDDKAADEFRIEPYGQLVAITLKILNTDEMSLRQLTEFRKREQKEAGHSLRDLRTRYRSQIEAYVQKLLTTPARKESDLLALQKDFEDQMVTDVKDLGDELRFEAGQGIFSKELLTATVAVAGTVASSSFGAPFPTDITTYAGAAVAIGGLLSLRSKYAWNRRSVLKKHPMAYLYELRGGVRF